MLDLQKRKLELLQETQDAVHLFLTEHPEQRYYAFALDCNAEYAEINLCLNTEEDFLETLKRYQDGPYGDQYKTEQAIRSLRYDPGDWTYQCFATFYTVGEEDLERLIGDDESQWIEKMMRFNYDLLNMFCRTEAFKQIPKTDGFRVLCIDHDEDLDEAIEKTDRFIHWTTPDN